MLHAEIWVLQVQHPQILDSLDLDNGSITLIYSFN